MLTLKEFDTIIDQVTSMIIQGEPSIDFSSYTYQCPFCKQVTEIQFGKWLGLSNLNHEKNCTFKILEKYS